MQQNSVTIGFVKTMRFSKKVIREAATTLIAGKLVAFPTETVYGLGADAQNEKAISRLYQIKSRPLDHPLIVHIAGIQQLGLWAREIPDFALTLARTFWPGPMTLILLRSGLAKDFITGKQDTIGLRVPSHSVALSLIKEFNLLGGLGIAAPSANIYGQVSPTTALDVLSDIGHLLSVNDRVVNGGQCKIGIESTIIDCTGNQPIILRPGGLTSQMIEKVLGTPLDITRLHEKITTRVSGQAKSHYAPRAKVFLTGDVRAGDGFIALSNIPTPEGAVRLASPRDNHEFAQNLYEAFRLADLKKLEKIFVVQPTGTVIAEAINDRIEKASFQN